MNIERQRDRLVARYQAALQRHCSGPTPEPGDARAAHVLGCEAAAFGLETTDLATLHDSALAALPGSVETSATPADHARRAAAFFEEASQPIQKTHRVALEAAAELNRLNSTLALHTAGLADSNEELQHPDTTGVRSAEATRITSARASSLLLRESLLLKKHLQEMARKILSANGEKRWKMSLQLNDEVAQPLFGIHVRLLALKKEAIARQTDLAREITITQRLVEQSMKTINTFAHEFGIAQEGSTPS